ncbi:MAG TPA: sulfate transporter CysZ [Spongiibacteraceae bacterium]|nr:sulfate transporter CysZ [Spongiibacteraceae bacterium]
MRGSPSIGFSYLLRGFSLMTQPSLRRYVAIPLALNFLIFGFFIGAGFELLGEWIAQILALLPDWLQFIRWLLWPLAALLVIVAAAYVLSICANIVGAPFNALLAEKAEALLTGKHGVDSTGPDTSLLAIIKDAPRSIGKELRKILLYLPRVLLVFVLTLLPPLYPFAPLLWFALGAWMLALEYCDYPLDNHRYTLAQVRQCIAGERLTTYGFGSAAMLGSMVPLLNLFIMPAAVCGATLYWVERLQPAADTIDHLQLRQPTR